MVGDRRDDNNNIVISLQDFKIDFVNYSKEGRQWVIVVGLSVNGVGGNRSLADKEVCDDATGNN